MFSGQNQKWVKELKFTSIFMILEAIKNPKFYNRIKFSYYTNHSRKTSCRWCSFIISLKKKIEFPNETIKRTLAIPQGGEVKSITWRPTTSTIILQCSNLLFASSSGTRATHSFTRTCTQRENERVGPQQ